MIIKDDNKKVQFTTSFDPEILKQIKIEAIKQDIDVSEFILNLFGIEVEHKPVKRNRKRIPFVSTYGEKALHVIKNKALEEDTDVSKVIEKLFLEKYITNTSDPI